MSEPLKAKYQRPEGALLERAMLGPPKVSGRKLAKMVGLSEGRVRQIVNGYKTEGGSVIAITAPTDTLARLAEALDISPEELDAAGRVDAADEVRAQPRVGVTEEGDLWLSDNTQEIAALQEWIAANDDSTSPPSIALNLWEVSELLDAAKRKHVDEMRLLDYMVRLGRRSPEQVDPP